MTTPRLLLALALISGCTHGPREAAPPLDQPPPEPPPVLAEVAPPPAPEPEPTPEPEPAPPPPLPAAARDAGELTTFLALLTEAGLQDSLAGPGPFTVFAPSDAAFAALPKGELERMRRNKKKLTALLGHHVVTGAALTAADLAARPADAPPLATLAGTELTPPAQLERTDIPAANGTLHVLPTVLQPGKAKPAAKPTPDAPTADKPPAKPADKPPAP